MKPNKKFSARNERFNFFYLKIEHTFSDKTPGFL